MRSRRLRSAWVTTPATSNVRSRRLRSAWVTTPATSNVRSRRLRSARVTTATVLAGAVVLGPAAVLPAAAAPVGATATATTTTTALTSEEHGYPGYFGNLTVVEDELSTVANHLTVQADFCLHPEARADDSVGFDIMWDAPISNWEMLVGLEERYTSSVPVTDDTGETVLTADMVFSVTELDDGWGQELKTSVDLTLAASAVGAGSCGTLELPIAAPLALADVVQSQPGDPADPTDPDPSDPTDPDPTDPTDPDPTDPWDDEDDYDPYAYTVAFVDQDGRRSSDSVRLNPMELPVREAWMGGELDFTGATHWVILTPAGPADALETSVVLQDATLCQEPYEAIIIDSTTLMPTNQEPDLQVSCENGTKSFILENRLRADRQLVIGQFDHRPGAASVTHTLTADLTAHGVTDRQTAQVVSAQLLGRITGAWAAPEACPAPFTDNAPGSAAPSAYHRDIRWMQCWSITQGYADGTFGPSRPVTRGELAAFTYRLVDGGYSYEDAAESEAPFTDVPADHVFAPEIAWLAERGVLSGYRDGTFRPAQRISRGEVARVMSQLHEQLVQRGTTP